MGEHMRISDCSKGGPPMVRLLVLAVIGTATGADEHDSETAYFADVPVVVSATRLSQRVDDSPVAVTVIDRDLIELAGVVELPDALRLVPGFQVAHTSGNLFTVAAHGTGAPWFSRVQVLIDGQSRYHTTFSGLDWANLGISLADVERIEVVRGANIPAYGANAIMGTVNIVTRQPFQDRGLFLQTTAGSRDRLDGVARWAGRVGSMDYRLTLEHRENTGFPDVDDDTRLDQASFRGIIDLTPNDELDLHLGYTRSELGLQLHFDFPMDDREVESDYQFIRWTHATGSDESFYLQFTRDHYETREDTRIDLEAFGDWLGVPPALVALALGRPLESEVIFNNFNGESDRYAIELQHFLRPHPSTRLTWGAGYRWDEMRNDQTGPERLDAESATLSANLEWRPDHRLVANLGAMLESNTVTDGIAFSPRLGLNLTPAQGHTLRASVTRAERYPSLLEEHWDNRIRLADGTPVVVNILSRGDLPREVRTQAEIGYLGRSLSGALTLDARLYHEEVADAAIYVWDNACPEQLPPFTGGGCYKVDGFMDYRVTGLEAALSWRPARRDLIRLTYAYADARGDTPVGLNPERLQDLAVTVPRHSASLLVSHAFDGGIEASAAWYYLDDLFWYVDGRRTLDGWHRIDLRLAKRFRGDRQTGTLELIVQGLGADHEEFAPRNRFEPRVYLRAGLQLR
jgi:iron complex outermembrane receptor protein